MKRSNMLRTLVAATVVSLGMAAVARADSVRWVERGTWQPEESFDSPLVFSAALVREAPVIDGRGDDAAWAKAERVRVPLAYGPVRDATLKAAYTSEEIFFLVSWADATRDDQHHPWVWSRAAGAYVEGPQVEDSLLLSFEAGCEWTPSLLSGYVYDYDGWRWLAARSDPLGQAVDVAGHTQSRQVPGMGFTGYEPRSGGPSWQVKFVDPRPSILTDPWSEVRRVFMMQPIYDPIYVSMEPDGYRPPAFFARMPAPPAEAKAVAGALLGPRAAHASARPSMVPQYQPIKLNGDAGEIAAKGRWAAGRWTVEFRRALATPAREMTDVVFERVTQFALHIFDATERVDEASESGRLWLQFEAAAGAQD